jgi:hypothetical protein
MMMMMMIVWFDESRNTMHSRPDDDHSLQNQRNCQPAIEAGFGHKPTTSTKPLPLPCRGPN